MKYTSHLKQLSVDMFRSSFDEMDKNNRWVELGDHDGCKIADRYIKKICEGLHIKKIRSCYRDARSFYLELVKRKINFSKNDSDTFPLLFLQTRST